MSRPVADAAELKLYNEIRRAIAERRLNPGIKLIEDTLASLFKVSRARVTTIRINRLTIWLKFEVEVNKDDREVIEPALPVHVPLDPKKNITSARQMVDFLSAQTVKIRYGPRCRSCRSRLSNDFSDTVFSRGSTGFKQI